MKSRRLLFIAYFFPPVETIASVRTGAIAKYLARLGWEVTVVTPHPRVFRRASALSQDRGPGVETGVTVRWTDHRYPWLNSTHLLCAHRGPLYWAQGAVRWASRLVGLSPFRGWRRAVREAVADLRPGDVDLVLASGGPWDAFILAREVAGFLSCPFVVSYRDLWSGNPYVLSNQPYRDWLLESAILREASVVVTVAPSLTAYLHEVFGVGVKSATIYNGYDPEVVSQVEAVRFDHPAIVYAGILYPPDRVLDPVFRALRVVLDRRACGDARFHYYGPNTSLVREAAEAAGVAENVALHGYVTRRESLAAQAGADLGVVVASVRSQVSAPDRGVVTGKLFELIGLGVPILAVAAADSDLRQVIDIAGGGAVFTAEDIGAMADYIEQVLHGRRPPPRHPERFAWPNLALQFDQLFTRVLRHDDAAGSASAASATPRPARRSSEPQS